MAVKTWSDACVAQLKGEQVTCKTCIHWCAVIPRTIMATLIDRDKTAVQFCTLHGARRPDQICPKYRALGSEFEPKSPFLLVNDTKTGWTFIHTSHIHGKKVRQIARKLYRAYKNQNLRPDSQ